MSNPSSLSASQSSPSWPSLPLNEWEDTCKTLHLWTQIVGKTRMALTPPVNHWWQVPLYLTARGLTTSPIPYGDRSFEILFDFLSHQLKIWDCTGESREIALEPRSVADFYHAYQAALHDLRLDTKIWTTPVEIPDPIPFEEDKVHASYDAEYAGRFWKILYGSDHVLKAFRGRFLGKSSPVHFFWGSFDLAVTRFSGRRAPKHPGAPLVADFVTREAYSHEVSSVGFWPGGGPFPNPAFYAYAYPEPEGFKSWPVLPDGAYYHPEMYEFLLPYETARLSDSVEDALLAFCQSTYEAAAEPGQWNRAELERERDSPDP